MLPLYVKKCLKIYSLAGIKAYPVGGCVRDLLRGLEPDDYDIAVDTSPETTKQLFPRVIDTGIKHGTVTVIIDGHTMEVTRFRTESGYSDCRRPDFVLPADNIETDLKRRDFTINAMAMDSNGVIIDPFGGQADLERKVIRAVGEPDRRFSEDALRIMRAFRFSAKLNFEIESNTLESALKLKDNLRFISAERIYAELCKSVCTENPQKITPLVNSGALLPFGISRAENLDRLVLLPNKQDERVALFLCLCDCLDDVCELLKTPNTVKRLYHLARQTLDRPFDELEIKRTIAKTDEQTAAKTLRIYKAYHGVADNGELALKLAALPCGIKDLKINGNDIIQAGANGGQTGRILETLAEEVRADSEKNNGDYLIKRTKQLIKDGI